MPLEAFRDLAMDPKAGIQIPTDKESASFGFTMFIHISLFAHKLKKV